MEGQYRMNRPDRKKNAAPVSPSLRTAITDYTALLRPYQWTKNVFVFTGVLFGHGWDRPALIADAVLAAFSFCLLSSAVYAVNDVFDAEQDRHHPRKRLRPVPSGRISKRAAILTGAGAGLAALLLGWSVSPAVLVIELIYVVLNIAYSAGLKSVVVLDVFLIAAGFILRILAGTTGLGIAPSHWLLACGFMLTLFLGFAKREAEQRITDGTPPVNHRKVLARYPRELLHLFLGITAATFLMAYSLYTMSPRTLRIHGTGDLIFTVPIVTYVVFRYLYLVMHESAGGDPARDLLNDRHIVLGILLWLLVTMTLILKPWR